MTDIDEAESLRIAQAIVEGRHEGDRSTYYGAMLVLSRALLALHSRCEAMAKVVEAAVEWSASFGELSKRLPPHVHALRDAVDEYERTLRAAKGER